MVSISELLMAPANGMRETCRNRAWSGNPNFDRGSYTSAITDIFVGPNRECFKLPTIKLCESSSVIDRMIRNGLKRGMGSPAQEWELFQSTYEAPDNEKKLKVTLGAVMEDRTGRHPRDDYFEIIESAEVAHLNSPITLPEADAEAFSYVAQYIETGHLPATSIFNLSEKSCDCGKIRFASLLHYFPPPLCQRHDPTVQMRLIQLATELKMKTLAIYAVDVLLHACGVDAAVPRPGKSPRYPHKIRLTRLEPSVNEKSIKEFQIVAADRVNENRMGQLREQRYRLQSIEYGDCSRLRGAKEGTVLMLGAYRVSFEFDDGGLSPSEKEATLMDYPWTLGHRLRNWWSG